MFRIALFCLGILGFAASAAADEDKIDYRQSLMNSVSGHANAIGLIAQQKVPYSGDLAANARGLALSAELALKAFEADQIVGGTSKAEIWENWDDFSSRMEGMIAAAYEVADAAEEGGLAAAGPKLRGMFVCKNCHDDYRTEDE